MSHPPPRRIIHSDVKTQSDHQLLQTYLREGSDDAFGELVRRYTGLVYASAVRQVRDPNTARDVAQVVFLALARQARSIRADVPLSAWLLKVTRFTVLAMRRAEGRRALHERKAAEMNQHQPNAAAVPIDPGWERIEPLLDEALSRLSERVRMAVVLRFFDGLSFEELADRLGITGESARQRVSRGIGQMRAFMASRGVSVTEASFAAALTAHAMPPPPAGLWDQLAAGVRMTRLAGSVHAGKAMVSIMAMTKAKVLLACAAGVLVMGGAVAGIKWKSGSIPSQNVVIRPAPRPSHQADPNASFASTYRPAEGQVFRQIAPPFIAARGVFWEQEERKQQGGGKPPPMFAQSSLIILWDGDTPQLFSTSLDGGTLDDALWFCANLRPWNLDKSIPRSLKLPGDFSMRKGATREQVMKELGPIVSAKLGRSIRFEKRDVARPAIFARGTYHFVPLREDAAEQIVDFEAGYPNPPAGPKPRQGTLKELLSEIKNILEIPVIDQTGAADHPVTWRRIEHWIAPETVLSNISRQTSLRLTRESTNVEVWFMVNDIGKTPPQ